MYKKIVGYTFLFYLLISLTLALAGVTSIDLMQSSNTFFRGVSQRFSSTFKWTIPNIPKLSLTGDGGWSSILDTLKALLNIIITISNLAIQLTNIVLELFEFIIAIGSVILDSGDLFVSSLVDPTMIM